MDSGTQSSEVRTRRTAQSHCLVDRHANRCRSDTTEESQSCDVVLGQTMNFDIEPGEFVQILHNGHGHWLTISTVGNEHPQVEVYDSAYSCCPTICKAQIAALLSTSQPAIELRFMDVQMQAGGYDCGLFAIAFATAVVLGQHPGLFCFDQRKMRQHFKTCLEQGCITMFPLKKMRRRIKVKTTEPIPVFCHCRMPELTQTTNGLSVPTARSGITLTHVFKLNQSTLFLNVNGSARIVTKYKYLFMFY